MKKIAFVFVFVTLLLSACGEGVGGDSADSAVQNNFQPAAAQPTPGIIQSSHSLTRALSDDEFNSLSAVEQYRVANKLHATLYKGVNVTDFFKIEQGLDEPATVNGGRYFSGLVNRLQTNLSNEETQRLDLAILGSDVVETGTDQTLDAQFSFSRDKAREIPLARIHLYPMSRQVFVQWMAWHLSNTILFSPAAELDSADMNDVQNVYRRLVNSIDAGESIASIVETHMRSEENWRRFRSPEDNTREMMEVFLGLEDKDDDVPAASKACQDWYLTNENEGYKLSYTDFPNTEPQLVLGSSIVRCDEFYQLVAYHPNLLPTIARTLVRYFYSGKTAEEQSALVDALISDQPQTFESLFGLIIFSSEYLLRNERLQSYEETFLATAERLRWKTRADTFRSLASGRGGLYRSNMAEMGWPAMSAKLGRLAGVATDSLSFANFHKGYREELLLDSYRWSRALGVREQEPLDETDERLSVAEFDRRVALNKQLKRLSINELIDYLFITVALRKATDFEREELTRLFDENDFLRHEEERSYVHSWKMPELARMTFDYLSRLSELYYAKAETGDAQ